MFLVDGFAWAFVTIMRRLYFLIVFIFEEVPQVFVHKVTIRNLSNIYRINSSEVGQIKILKDFF